jgi:putative transposase
LTLAGCRIQAKVVPEPHPMIIPLVYSRKWAPFVLVDTAPFLFHAQLVFVTRYRHRVLSDTHLRRMEEVMRAVCADFETELVEFNGESHHVHLLVNFPPKVALSRLVNSLKGVSSRRLRQKFPELVRHYRREHRLRSRSYYAASVSGAPISVLRHDIEQHNHPG